VARIVFEDGGLPTVVFMSIGCIQRLLGSFRVARAPRPSR